jgi:hypothetical protein
MARTTAPEAGDLLLRGSFQRGFELLDAVTKQPIIDGMLSITRAIAVARARGARALWQMNIDQRGRPFGEPFRLPVALPG